MNSAFDLMVKVRSEQLKSLKEKLQTSKLETSYWEKRESDLNIKKEIYILDIRENRLKGHLKYEAETYEYILTLERVLSEIREKRKGCEEKWKGYQQEAQRLLKEKKQFEILAARRKTLCDGMRQKRD